MNFFTYQWKEEQYNYYREDSKSRLEQSDSNLFLERGVRVGDFLYIIAMVNARHHLLGRMEIGEIGPYERKATRLKGDAPISDYSDHAVARIPTKFYFKTIIPIELILQVRFVLRTGITKPPVFTKEGKPDRQTFRGVRQLTIASARSFDRLLKLKSPMLLVE